MRGSQLTWSKIWRESVSQMSRLSNANYWNERAEDYDDFILTSRFEYGEEITRILCSENVLRPEDTILEIAGGVGALTLPLAARAAGVTTIEPAVNMVKRLKQNAMLYGASNVDIKNCILEDFEDKVIPKSVNLSILCHAAWQFPDIQRLLQFMEQISRRYCCLADTVLNLDSFNRGMFERLFIGDNSFDRVFCLYNVLCEKGIYPCISFFNYKMRRSVHSATAMWTHLVGKYRQVNTQDVEVIRNHVSARTSEGIYEEPGMMAVIWWKVKEV